MPSTGILGCWAKQEQPRSRKAKAAITASEVQQVLVSETVLESSGIVESQDVVSTISGEARNLFLTLHETIVVSEVTYETKDKHSSTYVTF